MTTRTLYPHLELNSHGAMLVAGTRYKASALAAEHFQHGWTAEELLRLHPDLRPEQVYSVLTWFYDNHAAVVAELTCSLQRTDRQRASTRLSRTELLSRLPGDAGQLS
jgi:uncharacterized protein (DUF433 family)